MDIRLDRVASTPQELTPYSGMPERLGEPLRHWLAAAPARKVVSLTLSDPSAARWSTLGTGLIHRVACGATWVGLSAAGMLPLSAVGKVLERTGLDGQPTISSMEARVVRHPTYPGTCISDLTWNLFCRGAGDQWLSSLWTIFTSDWFNQGAELIVSLFGTDLLAEVSGLERLTTQAHDAILVRSASWLVPLDANLGFFVGYTETGDGTLTRDLLEELGRVPSVVQ